MYLHNNVLNMQMLMNALTTHTIVTTMHAVQTLKLLLPAPATLDLLETESPVLVRFKITLVV